MTDRNRTPQVALVHDWLTGMRGGEYVLEAIAELYPEAPIYTLLQTPGTIRGPLARRECRSSLLQHVPGAHRYYRHFLPFMPTLIQSLDLTKYDLIISSSHCVAKGIRKRSDAVHLSYIHAPMRYMWGRFDDYFGAGRAAWPVRLAARSVRGYLQGWDRKVSGADRVDKLLANSHFVAEQVQAAYGRAADVVHPFVDLERFRQPRDAKDFYLMVGAFAPNKRVDLAIEAFNQLGLPLRIVGRGQDEQRLRAMAGPTIEFLGALPNEEIAALYSQAKAFIFPGVEDFGITPLEAMASGLPVLAFRAAGALETVVDGETGLLFPEQTAASLAEAVVKLEREEVVFKEERLRARAQQFTRRRFQQELSRHLQSLGVPSPLPTAAEARVMAV